MVDRTADLGVGFKFAIDETDGVIYWIRHDGIARRDIATGAELPLLPLTGQFSDLSVSPDGRWLMVASSEVLGSSGGRQGLLFRYDLDTMARTEVRVPLPDTEGGILDVAIAASGRVLVTTGFLGSGSTSVRAFYVTQPNPIIATLDIDVHQGGLIASRDGSRILLTSSGTSNSTVAVYDSATGTFTRQDWVSWGNSSHRADIAADGRVAVTALGDLWICDAALNVVRQIDPGNGDGYTDAQFSRDGRFLYVLNSDSDVVEVWETVGWTRVGTAITGLPIGNPAWSHTGELALLGDGEFLLVTGPSGVRAVDLVARMTTTLPGTTALDIIHGSVGADTVTGVEIGDTVHGGRGDDTVVLSGGANPDLTGPAPVIEGGAGFDTLDARAGATVSFTSDPDTFQVTAGGRTVDVNGVERILTGAGDQIIAFTGYGSGLAIDTGAGADQVTGGAFDDILIGGDGADRLEGRGGNDGLEGGTGADHIQGGDGDDLIQGGAGADTLYGFQSGALAPTGPQADVIHGGADSDIIHGVSGSSLYGDEGNDTVTLYGDTGTDLLIAEGGVQTARDILRLRGAGDLDLTTGLGHLGATPIQVSGFEEYVISWGLAGSFTLTDGDAGSRIVIDATNQMFSGVIHAAGGLDIVSGGHGDDQIFGGDGDDRLDGGWTGHDLLSGGAGDDYIRNGQVNTDIDGGEGIDTADYSGAFGPITVRLDLGWAIDGANSDTIVGIENLIGAASQANTLFGSSAANELTGGTVRDVILGLGGDDVIRGGSGAANELYGGQGNDTYVVDNRADTIVENAGEGTDTVQTSQFQLNLSANVENLTYTGTGTFTGVGNALGNTLTGGVSRDALIGLGGNDVLIGGSGAANELYGGTGDDTFVLDVADSVIEGAGEGTDTVQLRQLRNHNLSANVENGVVVGAGDFTLGGNALANSLTGGTGNDVLLGRGGNDALNGGSGTDAASYILAAAGVVARLDIGRATNDGDGGTDTFTGIENLLGSNLRDTLFGDGGSNVIDGAIGDDVLLGLGGNDTLIGGSGGGNNEMYGGAGDDLYIVDAGDTLIENAGEGTDTVHTTMFNFTLRANLENLAYVGPGDFAGTGNASDNVLTGAQGRDTLAGMGGADTLNGGGGTDTAVLRGARADYLIEAIEGGYRVTDGVAGRDGVDLLFGMEQLRFADGSFLVLGTPGAAPAVMPMLADKGAVDGDPLVLPGLEGGKLASLALLLADDPLVHPGPHGPMVTLPEDAARDGWTF